jgi:hypothetical protein
MPTIPQDNLIHSLENRDIPDSVAERTGFKLSVPFVELPDDQLPGGFCTS